MNSKILAVAAAFSVFAFTGAAYAACGRCGENAKCGDAEVVARFQKDNAALRNALEAKNLELRALNAFEGVDPNRAYELEKEIDAMRVKLQAAAGKLGVPSCCAG